MTEIFTEAERAKFERVTLATRHEFAGRIRCWDCFRLVPAGDERLRDGIHRCPSCHGKE